MPNAEEAPSKVERLRLPDNFQTRKVSEGDKLSPYPSRTLPSVPQSGVIESSNFRYLLDDAEDPHSSGWAFLSDHYHLQPFAEGPTIWTAKYYRHCPGASKPSKDDQGDSQKDSEKEILPSHDEPIRRIIYRLQPDYRDDPPTEPTLAHEIWSGDSKGWVPADSSVGGQFDQGNLPLTGTPGVVSPLNDEQQARLPRETVTMALCPSDVLAPLPTNEEEEQDCNCEVCEDMVQNCCEALKGGSDIVSPLGPEESRRLSEQIQEMIVSPPTSNSSSRGTTDEEAAEESDGEEEEKECAVCTGPCARTHDSKRWGPLFAVPYGSE